MKTLKKSTFYIISTTIGLAYFTNWMTEAGKDVLTNVFHLNTLTALNLVILIEKSPDLARRIIADLKTLKIPNFGVYTILKEIFIALFLYLQIDRQKALEVISPMSHRNATEYNGGKIKICELKRCFC